MTATSSGTARLMAAGHQDLCARESLQAIRPTGLGSDCSHRATVSSSGS